MLLKQNNEYIHSIQNYVQAFEKNSFRHIASNDFSKWPSPLEETWRLSRLGKLTRKKIEPIHSDYKKNIHIKGKIKNAICFNFLKRYTTIFLRYIK